MPRAQYHHGNLRSEMLRNAEALIAEEGPSALSLREVSRRVGVSHAAATHHFGDKAGLLTALAVDGLQSLARELSSAGGLGFLEVGVAYVRFAVERPGAFAVMFDKDLVHGDAPELVAAREAAGRSLYAGIPEIVASDVDQPSGALAAWALVHGLASLLEGGMVPPGLPGDPAELTRLVGAHLAPGRH